MTIHAIQQFLDDLNHHYLAVHRAKEDRYWGTYMGTDTDTAGFVAAERAWTEFLSDATKLGSVRHHRKALAALTDPGESAHALDRGLAGWQAFFESHIVEFPEARAQWNEILRLEADLFALRRDFQPTHLTALGRVEPASLGVLLTSLTTNPDEAGRRSSFEGLRSLERWVLDHGFLDIVKARNAFARLQGFANYFEYKVRKTEKMSANTLFGILDEFETLTREAQIRSLEELHRRGGAHAVEPWNQRFYASGDVTTALDPYFPFSRAVSTWVESFRRLGITFRGATLTLDLLDRVGKHENGFCHGPVPAYFDGTRWVPAVVNFTSNAQPSQVGSGQRALETLFHEGGHAAHFSNVTGNSPCFSQEFAPTSMAYAETQSMFLDSLTRDPDWMVRYARTSDGRSLPLDLIQKRIEATQPFEVTSARALLAVPLFERALYQLSDDELTSDRVLGLARAAERKAFGTEAPRPTLAVPHLLHQESAASYQGYLLAEMAVAQTRDWFLQRFGFIADNPEVGPLLARHYWAPGNLVSHDQTVRALTGQGFSGQALAAVCNRTVAQAWSAAEVSLAGAQTRVYPPGAPSLEATIRIVDGKETLADNQDGDQVLGQAFEIWLNTHRS